MDGQIWPFGLEFDTAVKHKTALKVLLGGEEVRYRTRVGGSRGEGRGEAERRKGS